MLQLFGFTQLIHTPTKIANDTESLTDMIAFNTVLLPRTPPSFSAAWLITNLLDAWRNLISWSSLKKAITCRDYRSHDPAKLSEHPSEVDWDISYNSHDVHLAWNIFKDILSSVFNKFAPLITKRVEGICSPLLPTEIKSHMNTRGKLMRKGRTSKINAHREE